MATPIPGVSRHARERMLEHHGYTPTVAEWLAAVQAIIDRQAVLMARFHSRGTERWHVTIGTLSVDVVWGPTSAEIVTVYPAHMRVLDPAKQRAREQRIRGRIYGRTEPRRGRIDMGDDA